MTFSIHLRTHKLKRINQSRRFLVFISNSELALLQAPSTSFPFPMQHEAATTVMITKEAQMNKVKKGIDILHLTSNNGLGLTNLAQTKQRQLLFMSMYLLPLSFSLLKSKTSKCHMVKVLTALLYVVHRSKKNIYRYAMASTSNACYDGRLLI